jgi:hypothetical protein
MRLRSPPESYRFLVLPQKWNQNLVEKVAGRGGLRPVARRAAAAEAGCANPALALSLWTPVRRTCGLDADACRCPSPVPCRGDGDALGGAIVAIRSLSEPFLRRTEAL